MRHILTIVASAILLAMSPMTHADQKVHAGIATVRSVNHDTQEVTLTHGQISEHNWPGMTMDFKVDDQRLFYALEPGKQVRFKFVSERARNVIIAVEPLTD